MGHAEGHYQMYSIDKKKIEKRRLDPGEFAAKTNKQETKRTIKRERNKRSNKHINITKTKTKIDVLYLFFLNSLSISYYLCFFLSRTYSFYQKIHIEYYCHNCRFWREMAIFYDVLPPATFNLF